MLNETDFLLWCKRLALTEKAQAAVTEARSSNPTRRVGGGRKNVSGRYAAHHSIRALEPRLCARLIARRRGFAERSKKALKNRLKAMLKENPPPSLREVHARLGITEAISYGNYPEIHRAISARHREFQRQAKSANRVAQGA